MKYLTIVIFVFRPKLKITTVYQDLEIFNLRMTGKGRPREPYVGKTELTCGTCW